MSKAIGSNGYIGAGENTRANISIAVDVPPATMDQVTPQEIILGESLLTPGLQTSVRVHSYFHNLPIKNLDLYKNKNISIVADRPILASFNLPTKLEVDQIVYRIDNRKLINNNTEEFIIHGCDPTLLFDAETLVSDFWKCTTPSAVVSQVLRQCAGAKQLEVESCDPARDYLAENIHPFQVVTQQTDVALASGNDPSFVHFMTYENLGTHHFKSLYNMTKQSPIMNFFYDETGNASGYANPSGIMTHSFPCDFDLLSDILNGLGPDGNQSSFVTFNPLMKQFNLFGNQSIGCGLGSTILKSALSNEMSAQQQNACPDYAKYYALKRQARMGLLEPDKIALRLTVPWNPILHAGKVINLLLKNKEDGTQYNYGSGNYLIVSMTHNLKYGGFSTTTMDCVFHTVGEGGIA